MHAQREPEAASSRLTVLGPKSSVGGYRKTRYVGFGANQVVAMLTAAAYNLVRMATLMEQPT